MCWQILNLQLKRGFFSVLFWFLFCITNSQQQDMLFCRLILQSWCHLSLSDNATQNENERQHLEEVERCLDDQYKFFCGKIGDFRLMSLQTLWNPLWGKIEKVVLSLAYCTSLASPEVRWPGLHSEIIWIKTSIWTLCAFAHANLSVRSLFFFSLRFYFYYLKITFFQDAVWHAQIFYLHLYCMDKRSDHKRDLCHCLWWRKTLRHKLHFSELLTNSGEIVVYLRLSKCLSFYITKYNETIIQFWAFVLGFLPKTLGSIAEKKYRDWFVKRLKCKAR